MKLLSLAIVTIFCISLSDWETDFDLAKQKAKQEHKLILLNFSGSDWCGPCIRLHDEIFENALFKDFANSNLILVNADFPRLKKNQLSKDQQKNNDKLADKYDAEGIFPYTTLLDAKGSIVMTWEGLPNTTAEQFTAQLKSLVNVRK